VTAGVLLLAVACPLLGPAPDGPGLATPLHVPPAAALALNTEGKALYRAGRWSEAHARYHAALAADPQWMAPALNAACALARQEHFPEAAHEAAALVRTGFIPWGREVLEAADLAQLRARPEMEEVRTSLARSAADWGDSLRDAVFFVARTRPPVHLGSTGVLVLLLNQELFAWLPRGGRYRQVTAEDGRILAAARSADGRRLAYVRAGKLVRAPGAVPVLRGLTVRLLDVPTMTLGPAVELPGDLVELSLWPPSAAGVDLRLVRAAGRPSESHRLVGDALVSTRERASASRIDRPVRLTATGVEEQVQLTIDRPCACSARDQRTPAQPPQVRLRAGQRSLVIPAPFGAGLAGLPFPR
jgi:hypothetical protein